MGLYKVKFRFLFLPLFVTICITKNFKKKYIAPYAEVCLGLMPKDFLL